MKKSILSQSNNPTHMDKLKQSVSAADTLKRLEALLQQQKRIFTIHNRKHNGFKPGPANAVWLRGHLAGISMCITVIKQEETSRESLQTKLLWDDEPLNPDIEE